MTLYYVSTGRGCCIRRGGSAASVERSVLLEVGTANGPVKVRKATEKDIAWVRSMGGNTSAVHRGAK